MFSHYGKFRKIYLDGKRSAALGLAFFALLTHPGPVYAIPTVFGEIDPSAAGIGGWAVRVGFGMVSGLGVVLVMWGAIKYNLSKGDPRALEDAKETITAALAGLVIVALAAAVMGYLGHDILGIPGIVRGPGGVRFPD